MRIIWRWRRWRLDHWVVTSRVDLPPPHTGPLDFRCPCKYTCIGFRSLEEARDKAYSHFTEHITRMRPPA